MEKLKILSLFTGVGGFEVGLSLSNLANQATSAQFVEINPFCQHVLATRFPGVPIFSDVKQFNTTPGEFDIVVGGVPCQSFSVSGNRKGNIDTRNLFPEYFRIIRQAQPKYAIIENVQGLLSANHRQMFKAILWSLSELGYSVEWQIISVVSLGGVHRRNRVFILAERQDNVTNTQSGRRASSCLQQTQSGSNQTSQYSCAKTSTEIRRRLAPNFVEQLMGYSLHWTDTKIPNSDLLHPQLLTHNYLEDALPHATDYEIMPCRKERLCALGNSISPQCAKVVWNRVYNKIHAQTQI